MTPQQSLSSKVKALVEAVFSATDSQRGEVLYQLVYFVKEHEGEDIFEPLESALPKLVDYLLVDTDNLDGCTISICRRVHINDKTIKRLLELQKMEANALVIEALGLVERASWNTELQSALRIGLSHKKTVFAASYALARAFQKLSKDTIVSLGSTALAQELLSAYQAIMALVYQLDYENQTIAYTWLEKVVRGADERRKGELAHILGWGCKNHEKASALLTLLKDDTALSVQKAVQDALVRRNQE